MSMSVTPRSTKAEILAALEAQAAAMAAGPSWGQVASKIIQTASCVSREMQLMVRDCYATGRVARVWYDQIVDELSRPVLKS